MKTKSKVFAKLMALVLAVVMVVSSTVPAFAAGLNANRADKATTVGKNFIDWVELLNDDACEAMLDAADEFLKDLDLTHIGGASGQKNDIDSFPMEMPIDSSMNSLLKDDGYVHLYLGNQKNANGKYYVGNSTGTSNSNDTESTTAPGQNYVHIFVRAHASALVQIYRTIAVNGYVDSVDGIIDLLIKVYNNVLNNGDLSILGFNLLGTALGDQVVDLKNALSLLGTLNSTTYYTSSTETSKCGKSWRKKLGAKQTMKYIAQLLNNLVNRNSSNALIWNLLSGTLSLGALDDTLKLYYKNGEATGQEARDKGLIGGLVSGDKAPIWDQYEVNGYLLYNALAAYVMNHELPTTDGKAYYGLDKNGNALYTVPSSGALTDGTYKYYGSSTASAWKYDKVILDCISRYVLQNININVTYPEYVQDEGGNWVHDSSQARFKRGDTDSKLEYNKDGNVYLFRYNGSTVWLTDSTNLYDFAYQALKIAWNTALKPTLHLLQVNYNGHEVDNHGTNFDNAFLKWYIENKATGTVRSFPATAYTDGSVAEWAADVYATYGAADATEFLGWVENTYDYDDARKAKNDAYNWRDIEVTSLFNQVRYSPLADKYFNRRTGPANLYFLQTGCSNIDAFMDAVASGTKTYAGIPEALNDFLVAAVKDLFPNSANVGYNNAATGEFENIAQPTGFTETNSFNATTIMNNIYKVLEYVGNTTNANIFNPYYAKHGITYNGSTVNLTAANIEEAIVPFGIACLKQWNLTAVIHNSDWDKVTDLESAAVVALEEYLGYVFPDRDYSGLWKEEVEAVGSTGKSYKVIKAKTSSLYDEAVYWMARDAAAYVCVAAGVPVMLADTNRTPWDPYTMSAVDSAYRSTSSDPFNMVDMTACYFAACDENFDKAATNVKSKGIAALFDLKSSIKSSNSLWTNVDAVFNRILPVVGELQYVNGAYKGNGSFSSEAFVKDTIIEDVKALNLTDLLDGVYRIMSANKIKTGKIQKILYYDILAPVLNSILGVNSLNSGSAALIPTADSDTPFDVFLQPTNVRGSSYSALNGIIHRLIKNLYLYFTGGASEYFYDCGTFLFMTLGMPGQLKEHELNGIDIKVYDTDIYGTSASTTVKIKNDSYGINRFFHNKGDLNSAKQYEASRYWVNLKSVKIQTAAGSDATTLLSSATTLAPEKNVYYTASWTATRGTLYKVVATYDIKFDDVLANGTASAAAAASTTLASNVVATKWIYVPPTSYTQTWQNLGAATYDGQDFATYKDSSDVEHYKGTLVTGTVTNNIGIVAGSVYDVPAANVASEGYGVRLTNNTTSDITGKFYVYPSQGTAYNLRANDNATTVATAAAGQAMAFLAIDREGNIYNKDGGVYGKYDDLKSTATWIMGYHKSTDLDDREGYEYILANAWNTPAEVAFGAPGAGTTITDCTKLDKKDASGDAAKWTNIKLFASGSTLAKKYTVGFAFCTSASARAIASPITLAYVGDMEGLRWAVDRYTEVLGASNTTVQNGAKVACLRYRNASNIDDWCNIDVLADAIYDAGESAAKTRAEAITAMSEEADAMEEIDYKVVGYKRWKKYVEKAENLREAKQLFYKAQTRDAAANTDSEGYLLDADGNRVPILDEKGRPTYEYKTAEPAYKVDEFIRVANLYKGYMEERSHDLSRINAEIAHATSLCDEYDETIAASANDVSDFSATATTAAREYVATDENGVPVLTGEVTDKLDDRGYTYGSGNVSEYRFTYSTKGKTEADNVKVYEVGTTATDVKFGAVENGKLVNKGDTKYTDKSWNAYIDALGEVITSINAGDPISKTYTATCHLVMAENELEPIDEPAGDNITVSGKVLIAANAAGDASEFGLRGVVVAALDGDGNVVAQTVSDAGADSSAWGTYELEVPAGTTRFVVGDPENADTIANREFTIAGDANVTDADVPVIMCDFNDDGVVNVIDKAQFNGALSNYRIYADFNNDEAVNVIDKGKFNAILKACGGGINYADELSF